MASSLRLVSVSKITSRWMLLVTLLLLEGGASKQNILRIEDRWKDYRGIGREGFFYNDSVIAVTDYSDDDKKMNIDENFHSRLWGSSLPDLRTRDPPLSPPST